MSVDHALGLGELGIICLSANINDKCNMPSACVPDVASEEREVENRVGGRESKCILGR